MKRWHVGRSSKAFEFPPEPLTGFRPGAISARPEGCIGGGRGGRSTSSTRMKRSEQSVWWNTKRHKGTTGGATQRKVVVVLMAGKPEIPDQPELMSTRADPASDRGGEDRIAYSILRYQQLQSAWSDRRAPVRLAATRRSSGESCGRKCDFSGWIGTRCLGAAPDGDMHQAMAAR